MRQMQDWHAAIAFVRSLPGVDPDRVATFGSSMGGGNALAAAAQDSRVAAAISQVPFLDMVRQAHRSSLRVTARMLLAAVLPSSFSPLLARNSGEGASQVAPCWSRRGECAYVRAGITSTPSRSSCR